MKELGRASDDRIEYSTRTRCRAGAGLLLVAELVARGLDGFVRDTVDLPRIVRGISCRRSDATFPRPTRAAILERRRGEPGVSRH